MPATNDLQPGNPHWHAIPATSPAIIEPHSLNQRYHAEENPDTTTYLLGILDPIQYVTPNARFSGALPGASAVTGGWAAMPVQERIAPPA